MDQLELMVSNVSRTPSITGGYWVWKAHEPLGFPLMFANSACDPSLASLPTAAVRALMVSRPRGVAVGRGQFGLGLPRQLAKVCDQLLQGDRVPRLPDLPRQPLDLGLADPQPAYLGAIVVGDVEDDPIGPQLGR